MGPQRSGGINRHLDRTREAVTRWLKHTHETSDSDEKDDLLLSLALENEETPEQPQAMSLLMESRRFGVSFLNGALWDWPYLTRLEFNAVVDAESEYTRIQEANARLRAQFEKQNQ